MGNNDWYYREGVGGLSMLSDLYLENLGWVWDRDEMDYVTDDVDLMDLTWEIESYVAEVYFELDEDEIVSKVLASCNYNDEEELNKELLVQLNTYIEQVEPELSGDIKEEVRKELLNSWVYEDIKQKADEQVANINLADKINKGISNTEWEGSKSEFVGIIRRGLGVTTLSVEKRDNKDWVTSEVEKQIRKNLFKNGYSPIQIDMFMSVLEDDIEELVSEGRWECKDSGVELRLLVIPKGLNGFDEGDRVKILADNTYQYLKNRNILY